MWDMHLHTKFSGDSEAEPCEMIIAARDKGLKGICFTDHLDYDYPLQPNPFSLDVENYYEKMQDTILQHCEIGLLLGIEIGLQPHLHDKNEEISKKYCFDFVIGSSHVTNGYDPYYPEYFQGKTEEEAYEEYFVSVLRNVRLFDCYDVYGHIDYVVRYGPNMNKYYTYKKYSDIIDEILKALIQKGKGIELNTGGYKYGLGQPNPTEEIIKRYKELGGELITVGADAHKPEHVGYDFDKASEVLKTCGFRYYTVFKNRKPYFEKL